MERGLVRKYQVFLLLVLFASVFLFNVNFVVAESVLDKIWDTGAGDIMESGGVARILLIVLVTLLVYAVTSFLPFIPEDKDYLNWGIAVVIGVLSFLYVSPEDVRILVTQYEALGIALTSVIPLVILIVFAAKFREERPEIAILVNKLLFIIFGVYLIARLITIDLANASNSALLFVYPVSLVLVLVWIFSPVERWLTELLKRGKTEADKDKLKEKLKQQRIKRDLEAESFSKESDGENYD